MLESFRPKLEVSEMLLAKTASGLGTNSSYNVRKLISQLQLHSEVH